MDVPCISLHRHHIRIVCGHLSILCAGQRLISNVSLSLGLTTPWFSGMGTNRNQREYVESGLLHDSLRVGRIHPGSLRCVPSGSLGKYADGERQYAPCTIRTQNFGLLS